MKIIQDVQIWDNGQVKVAKVLNAYAVNVSLNQNATFYYELLPLDDKGNTSGRIAYGNVYMPTEQYIQWSQDEFAWDFVASTLNLVITGDYVAPQPPVVEEPIAEEPVVEELPMEEEQKSEENI